MRARRGNRMRLQRVWRRGGMDEREEEGICLGGGDEAESEDTMAIDSCSSKPTDDIGRCREHYNIGSNDLSLLIFL